PVAPFTPLRLPLHLPPDHQQHLPRTDRWLPRAALWPQRQVRMRQQQLQRQQRRLRLTMHQAYRPAGERELVDRSLVYSEYPFIPPTTAVGLRRRLHRQARGVEDIGQQPDVVLGLTAGRHADQPTGDRRQLLLLNVDRPVVDQALIPPR